VLVSFDYLIMVILLKTLYGIFNSVRERFRLKPGTFFALVI
jgi:hypothetical protein